MNPYTRTEPNSGSYSKMTPSGKLPIPNSSAQKLHFVCYLVTDAKRAKLTPHNNHLPLQGVLVMKDTVSFTANFCFAWRCCVFLKSFVFLYNQSVRLLEPAQAMKELGLTEHKLRFTSSVTMETTVPHHVFGERLQSQLERWFNFRFDLIFLGYW